MSTGFSTPTRNRDDPEMEEIDFDGNIPVSPERTTPNESNFRFTAPIPNFRTQFSKTKDVKRSDYGTLDDLRERGTPDSTLYDQLINLILNAKKDIKFSPSAETRAGAARYAKSRGLRLGEAGTDINQDGVEDVVLYNKSGYPVVINGYHLAPSRFPYRKSYKENNPKPIDRYRVGGYKGYMDRQWGVDPNGFNEDGKRAVEFDKDNLPTAFKILKDSGWRVPAAPRRELSFYQKAIKIINDTFNQHMARNPSVMSKSWVLKCLSKIMLASLVYINVVDRGLLRANSTALEQIRNAGGTAEGWALYQKIKQRQSKGIKAFLEENQAQIFEALSNPEQIDNILNAFAFYGQVDNEQIPNDDQFARLPEINQKMYKAGLKETFTAALEGVKNDIIANIIDDQPIILNNQQQTQQTQ